MERFVTFFRCGAAALAISAALWLLSVLTPGKHMFLAAEFRIGSIVLMWAGIIALVLAVLAAALTGGVAILIATPHYVTIRIFSWRKN